MPFSPSAPQPHREPTEACKVWRVPFLSPPPTPRGRKHLIYGDNSPALNGKGVLRAERPYRKPCSRVRGHECSLGGPLTSEPIPRKGSLLLIRLTAPLAEPYFIHTLRSVWQVNYRRVDCTAYVSPSSP
jgi:hypothetical protein